MAPVFDQGKANNLECWTVKGLASKMHVPRGLVWKNDLLFSRKPSILKVVDEPIISVSNAMDQLGEEAHLSLSILGSNTTDSVRLSATKQ